MKYLIAGLGNIGNEYENTRHNIGFNVMDNLASNFEAKWELGKHSYFTWMQHFLDLHRILGETAYLKLMADYADALESDDYCKSQDLTFVLYGFIEGLNSAKCSKFQKCNCARGECPHDDSCEAAVLHKVFDSSFHFSSLVSHLTSHFSFHFSFLISHSTPQSDS